MPARPHPRRQVAYTSVAAIALAMFSTACTEAVLAPLDRLDQPTGMALSPRGGWLLVSNGNWDQERESSSVVALDLRALESSLAAPAGPGAKLTRADPCRARAEDGRTECDPNKLIDAEAGVRLPSGAGNLMPDRMDPARGSGRMLVPTRISTSISWFEVFESAGGVIQLECGRNLDAACDSAHTLRDLPPEPANIGPAAEYGRFAFVPHLLQRDAADCEDSEDSRCSGMELIDLEAAGGPDIIDVSHNFFRTDPLFDSGLAGGFAVAERPCDLADPPSLSRDCTRPVMYASQRYWFGLRMFSVAPETGLISGSRSAMLVPNNLDDARPLPLNGDLAFEDPDHLLMVHTTPPALSRIDTSLDDEGEPLNIISRTVSMCSNPNHLELYQPEAERAFAFVSCFGDGRVSVVGLPELEPFRTLHLGEGSNEMLIDAERKWLFVANVHEDSISVVSLDIASPNYMREFATLGLGKKRGNAL